MIEDELEVDSQDELDNFNSSNMAEESVESASGKIKLSEEEKGKLAGFIHKTWEEADASRTQWLKDNEEGLQLYWGIKKTKNYPFENCANLHVPLIRTISDTLHSNLMGSINFKKPAVVIPVGPEDIPKARKTEKLLNWQYSTQVDYSDLVDKILSSSIIHGIAPVKLRYGSISNSKYEGLKVELIPPERFLTPPDAMDSNVDEMDYCMQEIALSKSDIKKRIKSGMFDDISDDEIDKGGDSESRLYRNGENFLENIRELYSGISSTETGSKRYSTVIEWYGNYDINDDGIDEPIMVSMLKESKTILRVVSWDELRPFVLINISHILHRAIGESIPQILKMINQELNTLHNQRVDAVTLTNIPFFFFDPAGGFNPSEVRLTPGLGIPVNGSPSGAVYFPSLNTQRPEMYREEQMLFEYAERLVGAGTNSQGITESKRITATEIATIDRRAGIRFLTLFTRVKKGLKELFKKSLVLNKKYMPPELQVRITGIDAASPLFETIKKDDLEGAFDINVNGNSIIDEQADKQEMMQAYQFGMSNPIIARDEMAMYELTRDTFIKLGVEKVDAYLRKPDDYIPKNPGEEHNLFLQEEYVKPNLAENVEDHMSKHAEFIGSKSFKLLSNTGQLLTLKHYDETRRMKETQEKLALVTRLEQVNAMLLQSQITGQVPGIPAQGQPAGNPGVSAANPGMG